MFIDFTLNFQILEILCSCSIIVGLVREKVRISILLSIFKACQTKY